MRDFLEIKNLTAGYGRKTILRDVSLTLKPGAFVGLVGPNGAGKTTLLKAASGVLPPFSGAVRFKGGDLYKMPSRERGRQFAFVPQGAIINFSFTVSEIVTMGRYPYLRRFSAEKECDFEAVRRALEVTDTLHLSERDIDEVSAGEQQRVIIARALAQEPELLFLDEPTCHLDIGHESKIFTLLKKLNQKEELTILAAFHNLNLASEHCHYLILLKDGKIFAKGRPEEVLTPQVVEEAYQIKVTVTRTPRTHKPHIFLPT